MISYHNDPAVKAKYVARFAAHRAADEVIQGQGFENGRGCFVGCTLDAYDHEQFPIELGWPEWLARLADVIFEGLPKSESAQFGTDLLEAVPVGIDLEPLQWRLAIERHQRALVRLGDNSEPYAIQVRDALSQVIAYCASCLIGKETETAGESARSAVALAALSAESAALSAARFTEYQAERDTLLSLLRDSIKAVEC